jgi:hypothetical protein
MSDHKYDGRKHEPPYETESEAYQRGVRETGARYARLVEAAEEIVTRPQATLRDIVLEQSLRVDIDVLRAALDALEEMKK